MKKKTKENILTEYKVEDKLLRPTIIALTRNLEEEGIDKGQKIFTKHLNIKHQPEIDELLDYFQDIKNLYQKGDIKGEEGIFVSYRLIKLYNLMNFFNWNLSCLD
jgi:hypothetical protein